MEHRAEINLSDRQRREIEYHRERAVELVHEAMGPVALGVLGSQRYRWWNAYWVMFRKAQRLGLMRKEVLVVGCGFGDDAIQLGRLGASVSAIDISPESIEIARQRTQASGGQHRIRGVASRTTAVPGRDL